MLTEEMAEHIYSEIFGTLDDKRLRVKKTGEIFEWLVAGDLDGSETLFELTREWYGYDRLFIEGIGV